MRDLGDVLVPALSIIALPIFLVSVLVSNAAQVKLIKLLRERLPEVWQSLDSPTPISHFSAGSYFALTVWVLKASYESTQDSEIIKYGSRLRVCLFTEVLIPVGFLLAVGAT